MNILVVGSGGREHAICWKLRQDERITSLYCAPGNPGIAEVATCVPLKVDEIGKIVAFAQASNIDLVVVGPEYPLSLGLADALRAAAIPVFGPGQAGAELEASKDFSKELMVAAGIPTPMSISVTSKDAARVEAEKIGVPVVLKADGLAAGKGVVVCHTEEELSSGLIYLFDKLGSPKVLVEEFIKGVEASYIVATNGADIVPLASSHDYKRVFDGNLGPNTGGMGSISPTPFLSDDQLEFARDKIIKPLLTELSRRSISYQGFIYAGLMIPSDGVPRVIEFNARLGDPETQVILRRLKTPLVDILLPLAKAEPVTAPVVWEEAPAVCVVIAADGYPNEPVLDDVVTGIDSARMNDDVVVFHAGTRMRDQENLVTSGGRVLTVSAVGSTVTEALDRAYASCAAISIRGGHYRRDIGAANG